MSRPLYCGWWWCGGAQVAVVVVTPACCAPQLPPTLSLGPRSAQHPGQGAVGILWQSCSLLYTSTSVYQYHCTHYTGQPRMWSPAAVSGVVSCAQPGHGAIVITYLNISTIHTLPSPHHHHQQPLACFRYSLQIPASAHVAAGRSIQCQNCQILLQFISTMLIYSCS